jgi:hypothetical protein
VPLNKGVDKEDMVHIHSGVLFCHKKNEIMSFAGKQIKLEIIMLSTISQTKKEKYHTFSLIYRIFI